MAKEETQETKQDDITTVSTTAKPVPPKKEKPPMIVPNLVKYTRDKREEQARVDSLTTNQEWMAVAHELSTGVSLGDGLTTISSTQAIGVLSEAIAANTPVLIQIAPVNNRLSIMRPDATSYNPVEVTISTVLSTMPSKRSSAVRAMSAFEIVDMATEVTYAQLVPRT